MVSTSNSYEFGNNTQLDDLFRECFERIGIVGNDVPDLNIPSAIMSANLELSTWPGKGLNFWLIQKHMFSVYENQPIYLLPQYTVRVLNVIGSQPIRLNTGGTALSLQGITPTPGNASNCFDPTQTAGCIQTVANGSIGYDYGSGNENSILYVGITPMPYLPEPAIPPTYTLQVEYSFDLLNWTPVYIAPAQIYPAFQTSWFVIEQALNARAWRITETGGATLAIQQIYFSQPTTIGVGDRTLGALSDAEWMSLATKMKPDTTNAYYFNQSTLAPSLCPTMTLWPVPSLGPNTPTNILYSNYRYAQDVTQMFQNVDVPQRFYDALVAGISSRLALKFAPDRYQVMKAITDEAYQIAAATDYQAVPLRLTPNLNSYNVFR